MTKDEALKMAIAQIEWADHLHDWHDGLLDALQACKKALEQPDTCKLALENILHGSLLDKHNRNDDGMLDAKRWSDAERHLETWIKTAKVALDE